MEITIESKSGVTLFRSTLYELIYMTFLNGQMKIQSHDIIVKVDGIIQKEPENFHNDE